MKKPLEGKVAVVTGSGQGVGRGVAILLARNGAKVVTNNRKPKDAKSAEIGFRSSALSGSVSLDSTEASKLGELSGDAESTARDIIAEGGEAVPFFGDITDYDTSGELIQAAIDNFGRVDILVNNAAGLGFGPFSTVTPSDWDYQLGPKLNGAFNCMKHALPHMVAQGYGRVLNTASDAWLGIAALSAYSAANSGLVALTKSTAKEFWTAGITVNAFCPQAESPGHVSFKATLRTMLKGSGTEIEIDEERMQESETAHGPAENLTFLAYLASEEAAHISGAVFSVTGGGSIALYSEPQHISNIEKRGGVWTFEELKQVVPEKLLASYTPLAAQREF
ncbi:SDR family NAD(P)-dependent oxidoreductase [Paenarthrobacter sp. AB444]|uniref:SDR family NAD(P)-dependent oxidoreductase n=1 Tax=Paenarthrobacter sp. AB444 TaxID=3025681 RepID=UPI002365B73E|nr:SDR family NAD(P)-dependent oxidoreductase [Paenarthrobacter sp. AB444]MDD7833915.1 SDR family NAD(P)-dependent oxidoreductase [Paenarthrobacter sp. AB444]